MKKKRLIREYYSLIDAATEMECDFKDIAHLVANEKLPAYVKATNWTGSIYDSTYATRFRKQNLPLPSYIIEDDGPEFPIYDSPPKEVTTLNGFYKIHPSYFDTVEKGNLGFYLGQVLYSPNPESGKSRVARLHEAPHLGCGDLILMSSDLLTAFSALGNGSGPDKSTPEGISHNSLYKIMLGLYMMQYGKPGPDDDFPSKGFPTKEVMSDLELNGISIDDETLLKAFRLAAKSVFGISPNAKKSQST